MSATARLMRASRSGWCASSFGRRGRAARIESISAFTSGLYIRHAPFTIENNEVQPEGCAHNIRESLRGNLAMKGGIGLELEAIAERLRYPTPKPHAWLDITRVGHFLPVPLEFLRELLCTSPLPSSMLDPPRMRRSRMVALLGRRVLPLSFQPCPSNASFRFILHSRASPCVTSKPAGRLR